MAYERACALADIPEGGAVGTVLAGVDVALARDGETVYAVSDECSHATVALSEGEVEGCTIECWLHGSRFDLRTGEPTGLPATEPVATFPVEIRGVDVFVDTTTTLNGVTPA